MPLKAKVNGQLVRAPMIAPYEWQALQNQRPAIQMCCCAARGYMRVRLGTQHFVHLNRPDDCISQPESTEHEALKTLVMRTVADAGWDADIEVPGPGRKWIADILATKNRAKLAFEIQLSPITHDDLLHRHRAYARDGVRACWFVKGTVGRQYYKKPSTGEPVFWLRQGDKAEGGSVDFKVSINPQHSLTVDRAVRALLGRQFQWCARKRIRKSKWIDIVPIPNCWFCGRELYTYEVEEVLARCDGPPQHSKSVDEWRLIEPIIIAAVQKFAGENAKFSSNIAFPTVYQYPLSKHRELILPCVHCGRSLSKPNREPVATIFTPSEDLMEGSPHWCYSKNQVFCC